MFAAKVGRLPIAPGAAGGRFIHGHATNRVDCHDDSPFLLLPLQALDSMPIRRGSEARTSEFLAGEAG